MKIAHYSPYWRSSNEELCSQSYDPGLNKLVPGMISVKFYGEISLVTATVIILLVPTTFFCPKFWASLSVDIVLQHTSLLFS